MNRALFNIGIFILFFLLICALGVGMEKANAQTGITIPSQEYANVSECIRLPLDTNNGAVVPVFESTSSNADDPYAALLIIVKDGYVPYVCPGPLIWFLYEGFEG